MLFRSEVSQTESLGPDHWGTSGKWPSEIHLGNVHRSTDGSVRTSLFLDSPFPELSVPESPDRDPRWRWSAPRLRRRASRDLGLTEADWKTDRRGRPPMSGHLPVSREGARSPRRGRGNRPRCSRRSPASTARGADARRQGNRQSPVRPAGSADSAGNSAVRRSVPTRGTWTADSLGQRKKIGRAHV